MASLTYDQLIKDLGSDMLASFDGRVPLLRKILDAAGNPDEIAPKIHIVGTNGKGSTAAMIAAVVKSAGYKVGNFSSPAIIDDREQIQINGEMISKTTFVEQYELLLPFVEQVAGSSKQVSIFEWEFLIAMNWFANQHVDLMIIEAGLGGLLDATNAIDTPILSIFTHIDLDHTRILGNTIKEIATAKAGIIKSGTIVIVAAHQHAEAATTIIDRANMLGVPVINADLAHVISENDSTNEVTLHTQGQVWPHVKLGLQGEHQLVNADTALIAIERLQATGWQISEANIRDGFEKVHLPGRFTQLAATQDHPALILDAAHNVDSMQVLLRTLVTKWPNQKFTFLLGFLADKNVQEMLNQILPLTNRLILTTPDQPHRALSAKDLAKLVQDNMRGAQSLPVSVYDTAHNALDAIKGATAPIIITGSFYLLRALEEAGLHVD